jgi:hypothetical protein
MKIIKNEALPGKAECAGSLKNVLDALYVLNGKWKLALILSLVQSSKRFNEIQHEITGISAKVLANELKDLELNDFKNNHNTQKHSACNLLSGAFHHLFIAIVLIIIHPVNSFKGISNSRRAEQLQHMARHKKHAYPNYPE